MKPCPFCGSDIIADVETDHNFPHHKACALCWAQGPEGLTSFAAEVLWEARDVENISILADQLAEAIRRG